MSEERRQYERLAKKYRVEVKKFCFPLSAGGAKEVSCLNISAGGLLLESAEKFEVGEQLQVAIYISLLNKFHPGFFKVFESDIGSSLNAVAEVARVEKNVGGAGYKLGIKFVDVYEDDWKALYQLLKKEIAADRA